MLEDAGFVVYRLEPAIADARARVREQIRRVRATARDGGDVALAMATLRCLRQAASTLTQLRRQLRVHGDV